MLTVLDYLMGKYILMQLSIINYDIKFTIKKPKNTCITSKQRP